MHITLPPLLRMVLSAARAMTNAVEDAGIRPEEVTYINAHGTSTHHNDLFETRAIKLAFGGHAYDMKVNSTKSMVGHLLGAAGAIEFVTCVKEIQTVLYMRPSVTRHRMKNWILITVKRRYRWMCRMH